MSPFTPVFIQFTEPPGELKLTVGGVDTTVNGARFVLPALYYWEGGYWRIRTGMLTPSTTQVLSMRNPQDGQWVQLTSFTTGTDDPKTGTAPVLHSLRLTRVRYPVSEIGSGDCVFDEYHGFISFEWDPATFPSTPADLVLYRFVLRTKNGDAMQDRMAPGSAHYSGADPTGTFLPSVWSPDLDPTREYCLRIVAIGFGAIGDQGLWSQEVCAPVAQVNRAGFNPDDAGEPGLDAGPPQCACAAGPDAGGPGSCATIDASCSCPARDGSGSSCSSVSAPAALAPLVVVAILLSRLTARRRRDW
jgi:hypothetical protein